VRLLVVAPAPATAVAVAVAVAVALVAAEVVSLIVIVIIIIRTIPRILMCRGCCWWETADLEGRRQERQEGMQQLALRERRVLALCRCGVRVCVLVFVMLNVMVVVWLKSACC
jgi:hypothetical protein